MQVWFRKKIKFSNFFNLLRLIGVDIVQTTQSGKYVQCLSNIAG